MNKFVGNLFLKRIDYIRLFLFISMLVLSLWVVFVVENLLVSFLLAVVFNYLLSPCVDCLERLKLNRFWATLLTFLVGMFVLFSLITFVMPMISVQLSHLGVESPKYIQVISKGLLDIETYITNVLGGTRQLRLSEKLEEFVASWSTSVFGNLASFFSNLLKILLLTPFFTFFFLKDGHYLSRKLLDFVPNNYFELIVHLRYQISQQTGQFIRARIFEATIVGCVVWCGLIWLAFPFATLLALFAMLTNLVPYIGPLIGVIPAVIVSVTNGQSHFELLLMLGVYGLAQLIDNFLIIPVFLAKIMNLHPITVVVSIIIGAQFMGIVGMLISIPVVNILKLTVMSLYHHFTGLRY